jgi:hypothetical protein
MTIPHLARAALATALLSSTVVPACSVDRSGTDDEPVHWAVACPHAAEGLGPGCDPEARSAAFEEWQGQALRRPGSTFAVWLIGADRRSYVSHFVARIPESWGPGVLDAKAAFVRLARERASATRRLPPEETTLPAGALAPEPGVAGQHVVRVLGLEPATASRAWEAAALGTEVLHAAVVCDRSSSTLGVACEAQGLRAAFDAWVADGGGAPGASFTVYVVRRSRDTVERSFSIRVPPIEPGERTAMLLGARAELAAWPSETLEGQASAIAEAISVAASELAERQGRRSLVVLSDMREQTPRGPWNFERFAPRPSAFATWLLAEGLAPDLRGVPVLICGLHHRRGPDARSFNARQAERIREAWQDAFEAMGVTSLTMRSSCDDLPRLDRTETAVALDTRAAAGERP